MLIKYIQCKLCFCTFFFFFFAYIHTTICPSHWIGVLMISSLFPVRILFRVLFYRGIVFTQAISVQRSISFLYDFLHLSLSFVTYVIIRSFARRERQIFKNFSYIHYLIFFSLFIIFGLFIHLNYYSMQLLMTEVFRLNSINKVTPFKLHSISENIHMYFGLKTKAIKIPN